MAATHASPTTLLAAPLNGGHLHLWSLSDGTGLHAPHGELAVDADSGRLCCHLCGRWFVALGAHVRVHGYTADSYRTTMGLCSSLGLVAETLSAKLRRRTAAQYDASAEVREHLGIGQAMARSGQLAWRRRAATACQPEPLQRVRERRQQLAAGRASQDDVRRAELGERLAALGAADLPSFLRSAYAAGGSLDALASATGLGRARLRRALVEAGVAVRPTGSNTTAGKRSRARAADERAADRLGVPDLHGWLRERYAEGWTLGQLSRAVGHSSHWVRWRLDAPQASGGAGGQAPARPAVDGRPRP